MKKILSFLLLTFLLIWNAWAINLWPAEEYDPEINPSDFTTEIDNPYFSIPVWKKMVYEAVTEDWLEKIEVMVPWWTKEILWVETLVFWDRVYVDWVLIEDTRDYLAQNKQTGDLWYFWENVDNYEDWEFLDHHWAWIAWIDWAKPWIWMLANPKVWDEFRNEYYKWEAEDITKIVWVWESVDVPYWKFDDCVKTLDRSPLFEQTANKYFCKVAWWTALEVDLPYSEMLNEEHTKLIEIDMDWSLDLKLPNAYKKEWVIDISSDSMDSDSNYSDEDDNDDVMDSDFYDDTNEDDDNYVDDEKDEKREYKDYKSHFDKDYECEDDDLESVLIWVLSWLFAIIVWWFLIYILDRRKK